MRFAFLLAMAGLAIWGRELLNARTAAEVTAVEHGGRAHEVADTSDADSSNLASSCAGHDDDLVQVCWWMVVVEAVAAAVAGGMLLAQTAQGIWFEN